MRRFILWGVVAGIFCVAPGCGSETDKPQTYAVSGKVSLAGVPVENGQISFVPGPEESATDPYVAPIASGEYHAQVSAGPKQVKIESYTATGPVFDGSPTLVQVAPAEYNIATTLTSEVKEEADQVIDFKLDKKSK